MYMLSKGLHAIKYSYLGDGYSPTVVLPTLLWYILNNKHLVTFSTMSLGFLHFNKRHQWTADMGESVNYVDTKDCKYKSLITVQAVPS